MKNSLPRIALVLCVLWVVLVLLSWVLTAVMPNIAMRSLLSAEGIRWFFGHFTQSLATPLLVWLVLGLIACGTLRASGLLALRRPLGFRERFALRKKFLDKLILPLLKALDSERHTTQGGNLFFSVA